MIIYYKCKNSGYFEELGYYQAFLTRMDDFGCCLLHLFLSSMMLMWELQDIQFSSAAEASYFKQHLVDYCSTLEEACRHLRK